jgi:hypothetical protein
MTTPSKNLPKVPPFVIPPAKPPRKKIVDLRGMLSIITMFASLAAVTASLGGGAKLVYDIFNDGLANSLAGIWVKVTVLGLAFLFGWVVGLVCIRGFGNLVYPLVIKIYTWVCLIAVGILYIMVIQKLFIQKYDDTHFWAYLMILLGGLFVLLCLHLLVEDHDLRPFAIPLLIISVLHLFVIVYHYIFTTHASGQRVIGDFAIFIVMISISALMLMHIGILSPVRDQISEVFSKKQGSKNNGDGES